MTDTEPITKAEDEVLLRLQRDAYRAERRLSALHTVIWVFVAVALLAAVGFAGWYLGGQS
jgi:hypothetical protein